MSDLLTSSTRTVAVIGGGITGLVAAYKLQALGQRVLLFEGSSRVGGSIRTERAEGWLIEQGPNSLLDGDPEFRDLIQELGLGAEQVPASTSAKKRFIVRDGRLQALPMSPPSFFSTSLFSAGMKFRIFAEMLKRPLKRPADVSLEQFVREHFGQEAVDYGLNPFVGGVYAGDPAQLSAQYSFPKLWELEGSSGSILRGQMAAGKQRKAKGLPRGGIMSFKAGLETLTAALAARLPSGSLRLQSRVLGLKRSGTQWSLRHVEGAGQSETLVDAVLLALPAHALAALEFGEAADKPLSALAEITHPPVTSLFLGYRREQVQHPLDGFGALIPAIEKRKALGILFSSSLFDGRAPEGHVALTVMVGGMRQPEVARLGQEALLDAVQADLTQLLGVNGAPVFQRCTAWPQAIPQYNLGYGRFLGLINDLEKRSPSLFIGGNCRDGISVPNCICSGLRLAGMIARAP